MSRREFLKTSAALSALPLVASRVDVLAQGSSTGSIAISRGRDVREAVLRAVQTIGGMDAFVSPGDTVLIKPNASFSRTPGTGANTSPEVATAVANLAFESGASRVVFADHPINKPGDVTLKINGLGEAASRAGAEFAILGDRSDFEAVGIEGGLVLREVEVAKICREADVIINLPVLKHHDATGSSVGMKNLMGLVYDRKAFHRLGLESAIADLSLKLRPDLTVVDATTVLATNGPRGPGELVKLNTVIAGTDQVAVDVASTSLMSSLGYRGFDIDHHNRYISLASQLGIGDGDPESVQSKIVRVEAGGEAPGPAREGSLRSKPSWLPYLSLSAASLIVGVIALIYDRRKRGDGS